MPKVIYCLGNPMNAKDNLPLKIMTKLKNKLPGINFMHLDPTEAGTIEDNAIFIDTVLGIKKIEITSDLNKLSLAPRNSVHDYDLPIFLGLMLKLGKIKSFTIIGVPEISNLKKAVEEVGNVIKRI